MKNAFPLLHHLHADWNEIQKAGGPHQNPESPARYMKRVQEITYELKAGSGWTLAEGSQGKFYVQKNGEYKNGNNFTPAPVYLMFIYYYNSKGELMNGQFVENGQENIHQHFFTPENVRPTFDGKPEADDNDPEALVDYLYVDTTPWDKTKHDNEAEITGGTNPVGLKGVIRDRFLQAEHDCIRQIMIMQSICEAAGMVSPQLEQKYEKQLNNLYRLYHGRGGRMPEGNQ